MTAPAGRRLFDAAGRPVRVPGTHRPQDHPLAQPCEILARLERERQVRRDLLDEIDAALSDTAGAS